MFGFFQRQLSLRRLIPGGVDAHCHLLPGVDDGAADIASALEIIRCMRTLGLRGAICTPHIMSRYPDNTPENLRARFADFTAEAKKDKTLTHNGQSFELHLAAEYMLDEAFLPLLKHPEQLLTIPAQLFAGSLDRGDTVGAATEQDYLLIELPQYMLPNGWHDALDAIQQAGYRPLLAHPERYLRLLTESELRTLHAEGLRYQGNIGSLTGLYGTQVQRFAGNLHKAGLYTTWGTDAHSTDMLAKMQLRA